MGWPPEPVVGWNACLTWSTAVPILSTKVFRFCAVDSRARSRAAIRCPHATAICTHCGIASAMLAPWVASACARARVRIGNMVPTALAMSCRTPCAVRVTAAVPPATALVNADVAWPSAATPSAYRAPALR